MSNGTYNNVKCVVIGIAAAQASRLQQCLPSVDTLVAVVQCRRRVAWIPTLPALCARVRAGRHQPARSDYWSYAHREQCTRQLALVDFERHVSFFFVCHACATYLGTTGTGRWTRVCSRTPTRARRLASTTVWAGGTPPGGASCSRPGCVAARVVLPLLRPWRYTVGRVERALCWPRFCHGVRCGVVWCAGALTPHPDHRRCYRGMQRT